MPALYAFLLIPQVSQAADHPDSFARTVTGGDDAGVVHPATLDELKKALCAAYDKKGNCTDDTPRAIALDHTFGFRGSIVSNGNAQITEAGCMANACPHGGGQWAMNGANGFCQ
ncbi:hypothetical protein ACYZUC_03945 [Pseudomonas sp. GT1P32]